MGDRVEWRAGLDGLEPEWAELARDAGPFLSWHWFLAWREAFAAGGEVRTCLVRRDGRLVGALPLVERDGVLEPMANDHTARYAPLATDDAARVALMRAVLDAAGGVLRLPAIPAADPLLRTPGAPWRALVADDLISPAVETDGDFDAWRADSKKRWGAPIERFRRKMQRDHDARFTVVERPADLAATLAAGFEVEASGWKGRAGTAIISSPDTELFYRRVAEEFHARDALRVSAIELDGRMAAWDMYLLHDGRLHLLKTGFDESFRKLAPGLVTQLSTIEHCFEAGLRSYELLGERSEWKSKFATTEREHVSWRGYSRSPRAWALYAARRAARAVKGRRPGRRDEAG